MLCMEVLQRKPAVFRALTGVTVEEFWEIYHQFLPFWNQLEQERLSRPDRQRAIGGGRKYLLSLPTMLLMTLLWLRRYWNTEVLAFFFGVDKATVSRNSRRVLKALERMGLASLGWPRPPRRGEGKSLEEALEEIQETCPDLAAIIDGTEQRIQRPQDDDLQRQHYSGRRKAHTRKTILVTNEEGRIWMVALRQAGLMPRFAPRWNQELWHKFPKKYPLSGIPVLTAFRTTIRSGTSQLPIKPGATIRCCPIRSWRTGS